MNHNKPRKILPITCLMISVAIILLCKDDIVADQSTTVCPQDIANSHTLRTSLHLVLPSHIMPMSSLETYWPSSLFEAINGQADLYLKAGFVMLKTQRLRLIAHSSKWFEINIYQMNRHLSAFAVYSGQRRLDAKRLEITPFAYITKNALFFVHGCFYIEINGSDETAQLMSAMQQFAQAFIDKHPARVQPIPELSLFPDSDLIPDSLTLVTAGAFGFDLFKDVFVATYRKKNDRIAIFIIRCPAPSAAMKLSKSYQEFLIEYGGEAVVHSSQVPNARLIRTHDVFEFVFTHDVYIAGVHQAPTKKAAESLAKQLSAQLSTTIR